MSGADGPKRVNKENDVKDDNGVAGNESTLTLARSTFYKLAIIGIIALMVSAFLAGYSLHSLLYPSVLEVTPGGIPSATEITEPITVTNITLGESPAIGSLDANLTMVEFSDFQCPFCASFFSNTLSQIKTEYIDTGKIKFVYKHYPLGIHQNAKTASVASECAKEQGMFWEYHDLLLGNQTAWETLSGNDTSAALIKYAESIGLDTTKFKPCLDSMRYERNVDADVQEGDLKSVTGTPSFFIGSEGNYILIEGAQPFESFKQVIDDLL
ncbi:MAG TPA: DsbA family protein [Nitrososphaeraceae archaeon]|nr:DsbA family protein [Nitrososphaeraceae archaeon]